MSEEEIRLDQTIKVFDMLEILIKNNETCSYRYLIYDMLGFDESTYVELISGMAITNKLVECETQKEVLKEADEAVEYWQKECDKRSKVLDKIKEYINEKDLTNNMNFMDDGIGNLFKDILELLEEIE